MSRFVESNGRRYLSIGADGVEPTLVRRKIARLQALLRGWRGPRALVLVTHGITMRALGLPDPGEAGIAVVRPERAAGGGYRMVGAIAPP